MNVSVLGPIKAEWVRAMRLQHRRRGRKWGSRMGEVGRVPVYESLYPIMPEHMPSIFTLTSEARRSIHLLSTLAEGSQL